ncbi:homoserine kinase [Bacillota bacterium Lsc_1132]
MIPNERYMIKVPASSANLGPGFDSIGIAVDLFLTLEVELADVWSFHTENKELNQFPSGEDHFICQVAQKAARKYGVSLNPCKVKMESDIPLARGLGSSAAAIIAGIELADLAAGLGLTKQEKLEIATEMEGHPDNVGASLYGGLVVGCYQQEQVDLLAFSTLQFEMVALIPREILLTKESRKVLPDVFSYCEAVQASATANLLVAALLSENWEAAGKMMRLDHFHQPYRKPLIPFYEEVEKKALSEGAFGAALSGAGPTLLCFAEKGQGKRLAKELQSEFPQMQAKLLQIENHGSSVCKLEKAV